MCSTVRTQDAYKVLSCTTFVRFDHAKQHETLPGVDGWMEKQLQGGLNHDFTRRTLPFRTLGGGSHTIIEHQLPLAVSVRSD